MRAGVAITGVGSVSALGVGAQALWQGLVEGRSGLGPVTRFDASGFRSRLAGEVSDQTFNIRDFVPKSYRKAIKVMARDIELAVGAAKLAVEDAGLITRGSGEDITDDKLTYKPGRMGCNIGAGLIACETEEMAQAMVTARDAGGVFSLQAWGGSGSLTGMEALTPLWLLKYLPNMLACHVTIIHGAEGPSNTITCAEASGLLTIGESMRIIERGAADLCFAGSAESKLNPMGLLRLDLVGRLAATGDSTDGASFVKPFDSSATGGILGEGGGMVILENAQTAKSRNAKVYCEVVGFGGGQSDAFYNDGANDEGFASAVQNALDDAGIQPSQVSCIVPLGLGVPSMDRAELGALRQVLGESLEKTPILTVQPSVGNCVAGAGGILAVAGAMCLKHQALPAKTVLANMQNGSVSLRAGPSGPRELGYALLTSGSLGGQNAAVVLKAV